MAEKINNENLENALSQNAQPNANQPQQPQMSPEMEIGFHQGALNTLINERNELIKMAQVTEQIMQAHIKRLEELGVKVNKGQPEKK